jgi:hypothetical protein
LVPAEPRFGNDELSEELQPFLVVFGVHFFLDERSMSLDRCLSERISIRWLWCTK